MADNAIEEKDKYKDMFETVVNDVLKKEWSIRKEKNKEFWFEKINEKELKFNESTKELSIGQSYTPSSKQYSGVIYWYFCKFNEKLPLKSKYRDLYGIHIMPYCIFEEDVCKAVQSDEKAHPFYKMNAPFVDYDPSSANFHKFTGDVNQSCYQVVLIPKKKDKYGNPLKERGPLWEKTYGVVGNGMQVMNKTVKKDWYFPRIQPEADVVNIGDEDNKVVKTDDKLKKQLSEQLNKVFDEVFQLPEKENEEKMYSE